MLRVFRRKSNPVEAPERRTVFSIPAQLLAYVLFEKGGPLEHLEGPEKREAFNDIRDRLHGCGFEVSLGSRPLATPDRVALGKLHEIMQRGGVWVDEIKDKINRTHDYYSAREKMGRAVPLPWPR